MNYRTKLLKIIITFYLVVKSKSQSFENQGYSYLNPIAACQTKANNKKKTGIIGKTSTIGLNTIYASGNRANNKLSIK